MKTRNLLISIFGAALATIGFSGAASAQCCGCSGSCTVDGQSYYCDIACNDETCAATTNFDNCDSNCNDGICVLCNADNGTNDPVTISGSSGTDVICVRDGNTGSGVETYAGKGANDIIATRPNDGYGDSINGGAGTDLIFGSEAADTIDPYSGDDTIYAYGGNDTIGGGTGNETIYAGDGDDTVDSEGGNDVIDLGAPGSLGREIAFGGTGNDTISNSLGGSHKLLGPVICGESGNDTLNVTGDGHVCIDAGTHTGIGDSCTYTRPGSPDFHDVATGTGCESTSGDSLASTSIGCGCP